MLTNFLNSVQTGPQAAVVCTALACLVLVALLVMAFLSDFSKGCIERSALRRLDSLYGTVEEVQADLENLQSHITERCSLLAKEFALHVNDICTNSNNSTSSIVAAVNAACLAVSQASTQRIDVLQSNIASFVGNAIDRTLTERNSVVLNRLETVDRNFSMVDRRFAAIEQNSNSIRSDLSTIRTSGQSLLSGIQSSVRESADSLRALNGRVICNDTQLKVELKTIAERLSAIGSTLDELKSCDLPEPQPVDGPAELSEFDPEANYFGDLEDLPYSKQCKLPAIPPVIGERAIMRDGEITGIVADSKDDEEYPFTDGEQTWTAKGYWSITGENYNNNSSDIVGIYTPDGVAALRAKIVELTGKGLPAQPENDKCQESDPASL